MPVQIVVNANAAGAVRAELGVAKRAVWVEAAARDLWRGRFADASHSRHSSRRRHLFAIHRALRPGGRIILQIPNANASLAMRSRYIDFTRTSSFTEQSLAFVLANAGFCDIQVPVHPDPNFQRFPRRFWRSDLGQAFFLRFRSWFVRYLWRQMCVSELGVGRGSDKIPLTLTLNAVGLKPTDVLA